MVTQQIFISTRIIVFGFSLILLIHIIYLLAIKKFKSTRNLIKKYIRVETFDKDQLKEGLMITRSLLKFNYLVIVFLVGLYFILILGATIMYDYYRIPVSYEVINEIAKYIILFNGLVLSSIDLMLNKKLSDFNKTFD